MRGSNKPKEKSRSKADTETSIDEVELKEGVVVNSQVNNQVNSQINNLTASLAQSKNYGIVLHGFLKTRNIDMNSANKKSIFTLKSSWKLRYWRLSLTDEGLIFEKSRRIDTRPYKGILLPFGKTSVWESWGKRGDSRYRYGFTIRVACVSMQMEAAVDSEAIRSRWLNVLQSAFCSNIQDTGELVKYLAQKASNRLSKMTDAGDEHCTKSRSLMTLQASKYSSGSEASASWNEMKPSAEQMLQHVNSSHINTFLATDTISIRAPTYTRTDTNRSGRYGLTADEYDRKSLEELARDDNTIPRRYNHDLYDHEGYMSDLDMMRSAPMEHDADNAENNLGKNNHIIKRSETGPIVDTRHFPEEKSTDSLVYRKNKKKVITSDLFEDIKPDNKTMKSSVDNHVVYGTANHVTTLSILEEKNEDTPTHDAVTEQDPLDKLISPPPVNSPMKENDNGAESNNSGNGKQLKVQIQKYE